MVYSWQLEITYYLPLFAYSQVGRLAIDAVKRSVNRSCRFSSGNDCFSQRCTATNLCHSIYEFNDASRRAQVRIEEGISADTLIKTITTGIVLILRPNSSKLFLAKSPMKMRTRRQIFEGFPSVELSPQF